MKLGSRFIPLVVLVATACSSERPNFGSNNNPDSSPRDASSDAGGAGARSDAGGAGASRSDADSKPDARVFDADKTGSSKEAEDANVAEAGSTSTQGPETAATATLSTGDTSLVPADAGPDSGTADGSVDVEPDASQPDTGIGSIPDPSTADSLTSTSDNPSQSTNVTSEVATNAPTTSVVETTESSSSITSDRADSESIDSASDVTGTSDESSDSSSLTYSDVLPILESKCGGASNMCHGAAQPSGGLDLFMEAAANAAKDDIADRIQRANGSQGKMPAQGSLTPQELAVLVEWAEQ